MGPSVRIILRYLVGALLGILVGRGILPAEVASNPEFVAAIVAVVAAGVGAVTEWIYSRAKKTGGDL